MTRRSSGPTAGSSSRPTGAYFGADDTTRSFTTAKGIETQLRRRMGIRNRRYGWLAACPNASTRADGSSRAAPITPTTRRGRAGATIDAGGNCTFVFCAQRRSTASTWEVYWPGDDVVDFSGVDLYRDTFVDAAENPGRNWDTYTWAVAHTKPYIVCESGFVDKQKITTPAGKFDKDGSVTGHSLITDTRTTVIQSPQCVAYLSGNNIGPNGNNFIDTSAASLRQHRDFANNR